MAFLGTTPKSALDMICARVEKWPVQDIFVGCSGNFTIERAIHKAYPGRFRLHSCDINLYSYALGALFAGHTPIKISLKPEYRETFGILETTLSTPLDIAATVMLSMKVANVLSSRTGKVVVNRYYESLVEHYQQRWKILHQKTCDKLDRIISRDGFSIASYENEDVYKWVKHQQFQSNIQYAGFVALPELYTTDMPSYGEDYGRYFKRLHLLFDWYGPPTYTPARTDVLANQVENSLGLPYWMLLGGKIIPGREPVGIVDEKFTTPIYLYGKNGQDAEPDTQVVSRPPKYEELPAPVWGPSDQITEASEMSLLKLKLGEFNSLRTRYLRHIKQMSPANLILAVLVDGKIVGAFGVSKPPPHRAYFDASSISVISFFAVFPTRYPRLGHLILCAMASKESKLLMESVCNQRVRWLMDMTTVEIGQLRWYQYRNLVFSQYDKTVDKQAGVERVVLRGEAGKWSLAEGLAKWRGRYGKYETSTDAGRSDED